MTEDELKTRIANAPNAKVAKYWARRLLTLQGKDVDKLPVKVLKPVRQSVRRIKRAMQSSKGAKRHAEFVRSQITTTKKEGVA